MLRKSLHRMRPWRNWIAHRSSERTDAFAKVLENACKTRFWKQLRQVGKAVEIPVNPREWPSAGVGYTVGYTCSLDYTCRC